MKPLKLKPVYYLTVYYLIIFNNIIIGIPIVTTTTNMGLYYGKSICVKLWEVVWKENLPNTKQATPNTTMNNTIYEKRGLFQNIQQSNFHILRIQTIDALEA